MSEQPNSYATVVNAITEEYKQERLKKVSRYDKRLERHNQTFLNQTWQVIFKLKDNKTEKVFNLEFEKTEIPYVKDFLIIDSGHKSETNVHCYDLQSFLDLKNQNKRFYKSLLKRCLILAPLQKSAVVMKALIKILPRYNKSVVLVPEKIINQSVSEIVKTYDNQCYFKTNKELVSLRIGTLKEKSEDISNRIKRMQEFLENANFKISEILIKPSFGPLVKLR